MSITFYEFLKEDECRDIIGLISNSPEWIRCGSIEDRSKKSYEKLYISKDFKYYDKIKQFVDQLLNLNVEGTLVCLRYKKFDRFPLHTDSSPNSPYHHDGVYNINIMLNNDYDGGEFLVGDVKYKPKVGELYWYNSNVLHGCSEVIEGERYVLIYYVRKRDFFSEKI